MDISLSGPLISIPVGPPLCIPNSITFTPDDSFAYVTAGRNQNSQGQGIYAGAVDSSTGNLPNVPGSPFATSSPPTFGVVEPTQGKFLIGTGGYLRVTTRRVHNRSKHRRVVAGIWSWGTPDIDKSIQDGHRRATPLIASLGTVAAKPYGERGFVSKRPAMAVWTTV